MTTTGYDRLGRAVSVIDPNGHETTTLYGNNNDDIGNPERVRVTNERDHETETQLHYGRFQPEWSEDFNDKHTEYAYDPLGRVTSVWQPTEDPLADDPASWEFVYDVDGERDEVPVIRTRQLQDTDGPEDEARYVDSWVIFDSLLRERQTHTPSPDATKVIVGCR